MDNFTPRNDNFSFLAASFTSFLCAAFGANTVAIKISLSGLGVFTTAGMRFAIAAAAIFFWAGATGRSLRPKQGQITQLLIIAAFFIVQMALIYWGVSKTNVSRATLLINLQPFFVLFLAHFFIPGDRITGRKVLGLLMGFGGVALVFLEKKGVTGDFQVGDQMMLAASFLWACQAVYIKRVTDAFEAFHLVLYPMIFSVPFFFLGGFFLDQAMFFRVDSRILGALAYQGLVTAALGFVLWNRLLQKYGAVSLHSFLFIMPITGVLLGGLILGEPVSLKILTALVLIASGILIVHVRPKTTVQLLLPGR
jgi:drug/metabolite transporter (DMT)-like permease